MLRLVSKIPVVRVLPKFNPVEGQIRGVINQINSEYKRVFDREQTHKTTLLSIGLAPYFISYNMLSSSEKKKVNDKFHPSIGCIAYGLLGGDFINELKDKTDLSAEKKKELEESRDWAILKAKDLAFDLGVAHVFDRAMKYSMVYEDWEDDQMGKLKKGELSGDLETIIGQNLGNEIEQLRIMNFETDEIKPFNPRTSTELTYRRVASLYHAAFGIGARTWFNKTSLKKYEVSTNLLSRALPAGLQVIYDDGNDLKEDWNDRKPTPVILRSMKSAMMVNPDFDVNDFFDRPKNNIKHIKQGINDAYALSKGYFSLINKKDIVLGAYKDLMKFKLSKQLDKGRTHAINNLAEMIDYKL